MNVDHLDWPFFDNAHHTLATGLGIWVAAELSEPAHVNVDAACRDLVRRLGDAGWLRYCVPAAYGGELPTLDSRALCIARETLAYADGLADFYCVFARAAGTTGTRGISAFIVPAAAPGLAIAERIEVIAPHPLARLAFDGCRVPANALVGAEGDGFKLAMRTLDVFRASVAAAAVGFARRALDESLGYVGERRMFGATLGDQQLTQATLGEMATKIDAAALLTYRAAWRRDVHGARATREAAMAKMAATESAQRVIDAAVQLFGGRGVMRGEVVERLYREIRALRIYEGATEVQKLIIARELMSELVGTTK